MKTHKLKLMLIMVLSGISTLNYCSELMDVDSDALEYKAPAFQLLRFRYYNRIKTGEINSTMRYSELDGYLKGLLNIPIDAKLRVNLAEDGSRFIDLWEHPDHKVSLSDLDDFGNCGLVQIYSVKF